MVAPLDHKYDEPIEAVSVTLPPWQKVVVPLAVIVAVVLLFTLTAVAVLVAEQPAALVTFTV